MKTKSHHFSKTLPPAKIYFEDVEALHNAISQVSEEVTVSTEKHVLEQSEDLEQILGETTDELEITGHREYVSLDFGRNSIRFYAADTNVKTLGCFDLVRSILRKRRRKLLWIFSSFYFMIPASLLSGVFLGSILLDALVAIKKHQPLFKYRLGITISVFVLLLATVSNIVYGYSTKHYARILLVKSSTLTWYERNKDTLIITVIGAIVTISLSSFLAILLKAK